MSYKNNEIDKIRKTNNARTKKRLRWNEEQNEIIDINSNTYDDMSYRNELLSEITEIKQKLKELKQNVLIKISNFRKIKSLNEKLKTYEDEKSYIAKKLIEKRVPNIEDEELEYDVNKLRERVKKWEESISPFKYEQKYIQYLSDIDRINQYENPEEAEAKVLERENKAKADAIERARKAAREREGKSKVKSTRPKLFYSKKGGSDDHKKRKLENNQNEAKDVPGILEKDIQLNKKTRRQARNWLLDYSTLDYKNNINRNNADIFEYIYRITSNDYGFDVLLGEDIETISNIPMDTDNNCIAKINTLLSDPIKSKNEKIINIARLTKEDCSANLKGKGMQAAQLDKSKLPSESDYKSKESSKKRIFDFVNETLSSGEIPVIIKLVNEKTYLFTQKYIHEQLVEGLVYPCYQANNQHLTCEPGEVKKNYREEIIFECPTDPLPDKIEAGEQNWDLSEKMFTFQNLLNRRILVSFDDFTRLICNAKTVPICIAATQSKRKIPSIMKYQWVEPILPSGHTLPGRWQFIAGQSMLHCNKSRWANDTEAFWNIDNIETYFTEQEEDELTKKYPSIFRKEPRPMPPLPPLAPDTPEAKTKEQRARRMANEFSQTYNPFDDSFISSNLFGRPFTRSDDDSSSVDEGLTIDDDEVRLGSPITRSDDDSSSVDEGLTIDDDEVRLGSPITTPRPTRSVSHPPPPPVRRPVLSRSLTTVVDPSDTIHPTTPPRPTRSVSHPPPPPVRHHVSRRDRYQNQRYRHDDSESDSDLTMN